MIKDFTKLFLIATAAIDVIKEKIESRVVDLALQVKKFKDQTQHRDIPPDVSTNNGNETCKVKEKIKEELFDLFNEINHKAQINGLQIKGFVKDKLTELTNNALLDSTELNDIRAEIASLRAEITDLKSQINLTKTR